MTEGDTSPEPFEVTIAVARPEDAPAMAKLKYNNVLERVRQGLITLRAHEQDEKAVISKDIKRISDVLNSTSEENYYLVARNSSGDILGFCWMTWMPDSKEFQFKQFYVDPKLHRRGVGSQLFAKARQNAQTSSNSPKGIFLFTGDYNTAARDMYKRWGFVESPREEWKIDTEPDGTQDVWVKMSLDFKSS